MLILSCLADIEMGFPATCDAVTQKVIILLRLSLKEEIYWSVLKEFIAMVV
ncbi:hypothetical protein MICAI_2870016 [Microcystis sp. T1-4]|nr:hypothetical protein MICAI_2870016 [Microcystis sp. T1-4]